MGWNKTRIKGYEYKVTVWELGISDLKKKSDTVLAWGLWVLGLFYTGL